MSKSTVKDILSTLKLRFEGLSHVQHGTEQRPEQCIYLLTDTLRSGNTPALTAEVKNVNLFREVLLGFLGAIQNGIRYQPHSESSEAVQAFQSLLANKSSYTPIEYYQEMFHIMNVLEENPFSGIDPLLTIANGVCYLEAFDKQSKRSMTLELGPDIWKAGPQMVEGSAHICITAEFIEDLTGLSARFPLKIQIGAAVGDVEQSDQWQGAFDKRFALELQWVRGALILQGANALNVHNVDLFRIDFFNTLRTLRLNKAKVHKSFNLTDERESTQMLFRLKPGEQPTIVLSPWDYELPCHAEPYRGPKRIEVAMFGNRRDMLLLDRFLPYIDQAQFTLFDSALHNCLEVRGPGFSCSMVLAGFGRGNWYRRLQMESMLPEFTERSSTDDYTHFDQSGSHQLTGSETLTERKHFIEAVLRGAAFFVASQQRFIKRSLFGQDLDMERLFVLGRADTVAREHLAEGRVTMKTEFQSGGRLSFFGSRVREALREGESTAFEAEPRFVLDTNGMLRNVGCTCTIWKEEGEHGLGGPCSHLRALWLNYCQDIERLREAASAGVDTGPVLVDECIFLRQNEERIIGFDLRSKSQFSERWKKGDMIDYRHIIQNHTTEDSARRAFEIRCQQLLQRGFEQQGS